MSALGNIAAAQSAKRISKYNAKVTRMERDFLDAKREVNIKFYNNSKDLYQNFLFLF